MEIKIVLVLLLIALVGLGVGVHLFVIFSFYINLFYLVYKYFTEEWKITITMKRLNLLK